MRKNNDRVIMGYEKFKATVGVSLSVFQEELAIKSRELSAPDFSSMIQVHGGHIELAQAGMIFPDTDGLVTTQPGLMLYGCFADCLPIYVWDEEIDAIGLAHAGWQGTRERISQRLVERLIALGARNISAWIGPGISRDNYQVSPGFDREIKPVLTDAYHRKGEDYFFDLKAENRAQLLHYPEVTKLEISDICTYADPDYYSYRRDQANRGRNLGYIMLK